MPYRTDVEVGGRKTAIDDEQLKKLMASNRPNIIQRNKFRMVTLTLIAINVFVFALEMALSGFRVNIPTGVLVNMGAMYAPLIQSVGDVYRFVTPMFLHVDLMHLGFNMVALFSVGEVLERVLGKGNYLLLYFIGGITGNALSYAADIFTAGAPAVSAGASTSVFALFVAVALLGVLHKSNRSYFAQYSKSMLAIIGVNVAYTFLIPSISISGHLGGALGGLIAMFMIPAKSLRVKTPVRIIVAVLWVASLVYLLVSQGVIGR
ncbi:MAG: rhomboid family intramembrane serine protease [Raoultibacter sp.]